MSDKKVEYVVEEVAPKAKAKKKKIEPKVELSHKHTIVNKMLTVDLSKLSRVEVIKSFEVAMSILLLTREYDVIFEVAKRMKAYEVK